jgi:glycerol-3-phosphate dehydrogenase (NAD(P)+)
MQLGIIGSGSWATALAKILTDNGNTIHWWIRNTETIHYMQQRRHNPHYLKKAFFNKNQIILDDELSQVVTACDVLIMAVPSAYAEEVLSQLAPNALENKIIVSAIKGILPGSNLLLNDYLHQHFLFPGKQYVTLLGPCHAEEVASEKLSYLTFSCEHEPLAQQIAQHFTTEYINTKINHDVVGVQYAAILKNIYALGAGIAHGLEYGDNFQSVYIANAANEMVKFSRKTVKNFSLDNNQINYAASVYLGDLLVTCYSLYSRNRTFGNMIGKGYSVKAAQLELNMVAEGYNASKCIHIANKSIEANIPIADIIFQILWNDLPAEDGFKQIEAILE